MRRDAFGELHPAVTFGFFMCAVIFSIIVQDPLWTGASLVASALCLVSVRGRGAWRMVAAMAAAFVAIAAVNALLNAHGSTVLFIYLGGRPFTLEALLSGMQTAGMFASVMLWFGSYAQVVTTDRFTYLFGNAAPAVTLTFTMALRLVPTCLRRAQRISAARAGIGRSVRAGSVRARAASGLEVLSALTARSLEGAIITADSMRSRGYGSGARTQMACVRFAGRDAAVTAAGAVLFAGAAFGIARGWASAQFLPTVVLAPPSGASAVTLAAFAGFLLIPVIVNAKEGSPWRSSSSRI